MVFKELYGKTTNLTPCRQSKLALRFHLNSPYWFSGEMENISEKPQRVPGGLNLNQDDSFYSACCESAYSHTSAIFPSSNRLKCIPSNLTVSPFHSISLKNLVVTQLPSATWWNIESPRSIYLRVAKVYRC